ncbi:MAG TPA: hypothetical protein VE174_07770 [Actinomycetota bacterium]|nr:hypothetical protein [Actinomycetota bacterium]
MRSIAALVVVALVTGACSSSGAGKTRTADPSTCPEATPGDAGIDVPGLVVPPGFVALKARPTGQRLTRIKGYIDMTPIAIYRYYKKFERDKTYEYFLLEHEIIEAEAFFSTGKHRNFVTAREVCPGRSNMFVFIGPEDYSKDP